MKSDKQFELDILQVLVKHCKIPEKYLKDQKIRFEFDDLTRTGKQSKIAVAILAEKFNTSEKNIEYIIYHKKNT